MADIISGWQGIAGTAIVISIILAGMALGIGRAFSFKRLERLGVDELLQSVINAAILGFAIGLSMLVLQIGAELSPSMQGIPCASNSTPADLAVCTINASTQSAFALSLDVMRIQNTLSYYQTLDLHFGNFSIQPLANLASASNQLANSLYSIQLSTFAGAINAHVLSFISSGWFGTIFAAGMVLRTFFLSRKFGAFLIAASISLIIFYPLAMMMFSAPLPEIEAARASSTSFLNNTAYETVPIIDLNSNDAIAEKLYNMSFSVSTVQTGNGTNMTNSTITTDFTGDLALLVQQTTAASAALFFYCVVVPLLALVATLVLIKELSQSFAGEIATEISQI